jgi:hypothetical protein
MRRTFFLFPALCCLALLLSACGYTLRGQEDSTATRSVLGDGSQTLKFLSVEQSTVQTNLTHVIRSQLRDEINARHLAVWQDSGATDLGLVVRVDNFRIWAYGQSRSQNLLYNVSIRIEFLVYDGRTNTVAWRSGLIGYGEQYTNVDEETAIREILSSAIRRGVDRMQRKF